MKKANIDKMLAFLFFSLPDYNKLSMICSVVIPSASAL